MGLAPSASLNPERRFPSTFEPIHGSAPDIAGTGRANPLGSIWSSAMMLGHLGFPEWDKAVRDAIELSIRKPEGRTADLGGTAATSQVGDAVAALLGEAARQVPAADTTVRSA